MKKFIYVGAVALAGMTTTAIADGHETIVIGVSIPAATHGWAGGMDSHAQEAVDRLEAVYPNLDFVSHRARPCQASE